MFQYCCELVKILSRCINYTLLPTVHFNLKLMKQLVIALVISLASVSLHAQESVPTAESVLTDAYVKAAAANKKVFVIFHASWCGWCRKMDSALADPGIAPLIDKNYVVTHLTVYEQKGKQHLENPGAREVITEWKGEGQGLPYWVILDHTGQRLADSQIRKGGLLSSDKGENAGCPVSPEELAHLRAVLIHTSSLSSQEIDKVIERFDRINNTINR